MEENKENEKSSFCLFFLFKSYLKILLCVHARNQKLIYLTLNEKED